MSNTIKKNAQGYGYRYSDISQVHEWLEANGLYYYQYIERIDGDDYIYTVPIIGGEEQPARRGCRVVTAQLSKSNPAQEQGAAITYARRYSLLMAFGLATTDDDAECLTRNVENQGITQSKVNSILKKCESDGVDVSIVLKKCNIKDLAEMTEKQFSWLCHYWTKEILNGDKGKN